MQPRSARESSCLLALLLGAAGGGAVGATGGVLAGIARPECGGSLRAAGDGALLFGAAGLASSPLLFVLSGGGR